MKSLKRSLALGLILGALSISAPAAAEVGVEADAEDSWELGFGARIGGYGFREVQGDSLDWQDCRMDGTGVFMTVDVTEHFFGEVGLDLYFATGPTVAAGMDRVSLHNQYAAGFRFLPDFFFTPYVQVGGGPEVTYIEVDGAEKTMVVPSGFMGIGGELNIGSLKLGMNIRALMMTHPVHDHGADGSYELALEPTGHHHGAPQPASASEVETDWEVAGQAQFFARYEF